MTNWQAFRSPFQCRSKKHINIHVFKYRFSIIITTMLFLCLLISSNSSSSADNVQQTANDCSRTYFQRQIVNDDDQQWSGLIEFGVSRKQMWGFDVTVVFLFDDKTFKIHGRPIINFELQKSYFHVLEGILQGDKVSINVTFPVKFQKSILKIVSIELDYQVICEDKNANTKMKGEMFSFDFKFKAPSEAIKKLSMEIEQTNKGIASNICGIPNESDLNDERLKGSEIDEDRLESKTWPWIASLYVDEKYRCTVNMVTRSEAVTASNCLTDVSSKIESHLLRIETYNNKNYLVRNVTTYGMTNSSNSFAVLLLEDALTEPNFVPACLTSSSKNNNLGSIIGFEKKFHEDYVVLNRVNITTMSIKDCVDIKNGSLVTESHPNKFCGISKNGLTWLELDGLDGAGFYVELSHQWYLAGIFHECLRLNDTNDCDFDSPIIIMDVPIDWLLNLTLYHPLGLEPHQMSSLLYEGVNKATYANSMNTLVILLILVITFVCFVGMWGLWYTCRKRNRPLISEVPSLINTNDGIQLLKRENKRFSYLN